MQFFPPHQYQPACKQLFEDYKTKIQQLIPFAIVEHIGSSAIPNAISKGDLDIYIEVPSQYFLNSIEQLKMLKFKEKLDTLRTDNLCMLESLEHDVAFQIVTTDSEFCNFLIFRDRLRQAPDLVTQYNRLKQNCVGFNQDQYREIKSNFIQQILDQE